MKQRWRIDRILLAVLLLVLAILLFYYWPIGPRWEVANEEPLGFDLTKGLLYTVNSKPIPSGDTFRLFGYDLASGQRLVNLPLELSNQDASDHPNWSALLSADSKKLVCWTDSGQGIVVFDIAQDARRLFGFKPGNIFVDSIGFSADGKLLAFRNAYEVHVWDCTTGKLQQTLKMPNGTITGYRSGIWVTHLDQMQFSHDNQYLAVGGEINEVVVFHIASGRVIGQCVGSKVSLFETDGKTLINLPAVFQSGHLQRFEIQGGALITSPSPESPEIEQDRLLTANLHSILTFQPILETPKPLPEWIPRVVRDYLTSLRGRPKIIFNIKSSDTHTGQLQQEFALRAANISNPLLSSDGSYLAIMDYAQLCLWDIPPRRSLTCWLVCIGMAALAFWLAWPRRMKQSSG
ncbi:MAG TPA: WD40 repeat domain-containing protein [Gemmatales bacterium]|nr:WD40 repeat domain-containing protein [Gemmatales bacterium]